MTGFADEPGTELRQLFFETAQELLQTLNDDALNLEKHPGDFETVRDIRRTVHTLKGDAAACGFHELSELAHEVEDALALEHTASPFSLAEVAFTAADAFEAMLVSYRGNLALPSAEPLRKMVRALAQDTKLQTPVKDAKAPGTRGGTQAAWTKQERLLIQDALNQGKRVYQIAIHLDPLCAMPIAARQLLLNAFSGIGQVLSAPPESGLPQAAKQLLFALTTAQSPEQIASRCRIPTITAGVAVEEILHLSGEAGTTSGRLEEKNSAERPSPTTGPPAPAASESASGQEPPSISTAAENTLRVDAKRVDSLLNLVGELVIGKSMLQQILADFTRRYPKDPLRARLADSLAFQSRILNDLQHSVMKVRMVPVDQLFRRFPRMVRDVAQRCGKQVELAVSGQDTDLDKSLLDAIAEPLTHMVRNAVSHGIEPEEERLRRGKPACGTIRLKAYYEGNQVVVEVGDDGNGIDLQHVKAKAVEQELLAVEESAALSEAEILDLVFQPGFTTAPQVNEISGRGVGLDVVRSVLQRLKGTVEIVNRPGKGTIFRMKLPLTLAIIKALLFRVEGRLYAIPLNAVDEIARALESDLHRVDGCDVLQLRGQALQLVRLGRLRTDVPKYPRNRIFILVIAAGNRQLGLIVDALQGEEELVIKAMDDQTVDTDMVSGASILGDGRVVLILNLAAVVERCSSANANSDRDCAAGLLLLHDEQAARRGSALGGGQ